MGWFLLVVVIGIGFWLYSDRFKKDPEGWTKAGRRRSVKVWDKLHGRDIDSANQGHEEVDAEKYEEIEPIATSLADVNRSDYYKAQAASLKAGMAVSLYQNEFTAPKSDPQKVLVGFGTSLAGGHIGSAPKKVQDELKANLASGYITQPTIESVEEKDGKYTVKMTIRRWKPRH